jgi:isochorismate synthases
MDIAFTNIPVAPDTTLSWSADYNQDQILAAFQSAVRRTQQLQHRILVSITLPVSSCDPVTMFSAFAQLSAGNRFFWSRDTDQRALVGVGEALAIETATNEHVASAAVTWSELIKDALTVRLPGNVPSYTTGPLLFGGFAFDPHNSPTSTWTGFPAGLLLLPSLLFHSDEKSAALTLNTFVETDNTAEQLTTTTIEILTKLQSLLHTSPHEQAATTPEIAKQLHIQDTIPAARWCAKVQTIVDLIQSGAFAKAVLARSVQVSSVDGQDFDIPATLRRLRHSYPEAYVFAVQRGDRYFIGATPERLVCSADGQIQTMALAGSAPRGKTKEEDQRLGAELLKSSKNQGEHQLVVETIQNALASLCSRVWVADTPRLLKLRNIQHLETPLMGDLKTGHNLLEAIEELHPTPAVGGYPRQAALSAIRAHEQLDRGWYAGPIGWVGAGGNGEFAVALRSGLVEGPDATLFAGCGIVASSDPESEYQESCWKLQVMLRSLGGEERGEDDND